MFYYKQTLFFLLSLATFLFSQNSMMGNQDKNYDIYRSDIGTRQQIFNSQINPKFLSHYHNFYRNNVNARVNIAHNYTGLSASLLKLKNGRTSLGFSMQLNQLVSTNQSVRDYYTQLQPTNQYYFVPILFNIKFHLMNQAEVHDFVPYVIAGLGPALGLYFPQGNNFFRGLSSISAEIGGGGFAGAGVDYMWQQEWALSFDIRYNIFSFSQLLGLDKDYEGISFFFGFSRALDY